MMKVLLDIFNFTIFCYVDFRVEEDLLYRTKFN